jgi:septum formation protein
MRLYLASASPRRLALLREAGFHPELLDQDAAEERLDGEPPDAMVLRLARAKATSALEQSAGPLPEGVVLGADTAVLLDEEILGKPRDAGEAGRMLRRLSGRRHRVLTGVALIRSGDRRFAGGVETTTVEFHPLTDDAIERYVATGSPLDKAGAYGIQDLDETWIAGTQGPRDNVIGLPVERVGEWLALLR